MARSNKIKPNVSESQMCIQFVKQVNSLVKWGQCAPNFKMIHIPNEQVRKSPDSHFHMLAGKKLKDMGRLAGAGDYIFHWLAGNLMTFGYLEFKTGRNKLTDSQKAFQQWCYDAGVPYAVCRSVEEAINTLRLWGALK